MKNEKEKEITINELAAIVKAGFEVADKRTDVKIEKLAQMVGNGFNEMGEQIGKIKQDICLMKQDISSLKQGQIRIETRLDNAVYRSELEVVIGRVQTLERQMKIALKKN